MFRDFDRDRSRLGYRKVVTAAGAVWLVAYGEPADPVALERAYADAKLVQPRGEAR